MANRIKSLRLSCKMSQQELSEKVLSCQKSIANWENDVTFPPADIVVRLADVFACSADYLLGREDDCGNINTNADLSEQERQLLYWFDQCDKAGKKSILTYIQYLAEK